MSFRTGTKKDISSEVTSKSRSIFKRELLKPFEFFVIWAKAILSNAKLSIWQHETWIHGVRGKAGDMGDSGATDRATCGRQKYVVQFIIRAFDRGENTYMPALLLGASCVLQSCVLRQQKKTA